MFSFIKKIFKPKDENSYFNIWDNEEVDATNFKFPEFEVSPPQSEEPVERVGNEKPSTGNKL